MSPDESLKMTYESLENHLKDALELVRLLAGQHDPLEVPRWLEPGRKGLIVIKTVDGCVLEACFEDENDLRSRYLLLYRPRPGVGGEERWKEVRIAHSWHYRYLLEIRLNPLQHVVFLHLYRELNKREDRKR